MIQSDVYTEERCDPRPNIFQRSYNYKNLNDGLFFYTFNNMGYFFFFFFFFFCALQKEHLETRLKIREEQGIERADFGELRTPFQLQILARVQALEVTDS